MRYPKVISIDLGASGAKICSVGIKDGKFIHEEIGRFKTRGLVLRTNDRFSLVWNLPRFYEEIVNLLMNVEGEFESIAIDTWGVDFALLDSKGRLLFLPYHYRDERTVGVMEKALRRIGEERIYDRTGIQFMPINTLYQLYSMVLNDDDMLKMADTFLMIPDLLNYWFTGEKVCEYTISTTTQFYDYRNEDWAWDILEDLSIPTGIFPRIVSPGTILGELELEDKKFKIIASASHDTASAVVGVPFDGEGIYISSGTWSLIGVELDEPLVNEKSRKLNFTNEGGYGGKIRFLKNATGMWLIEQCNEKWGMNYVEMIERAKRGKRFFAFLDPDHSDFLLPGNMEKKIVENLRRNGQRIPDDRETFIRLLYENMVFNYKWIVENLENILSTKFDVIHVVGGASRNDFLNSLIADAIGKTVVAGPYEATSYGNAMVQMISLGWLDGLNEARKTLRESVELRIFTPKETNLWDEMYRKWLEIKRSSNL